MDRYRKLYIVSDFATDFEKTEKRFKDPRNMGKCPDLISRNFSISGTELKNKDPKESVIMGAEAKLKEAEAKLKEAQAKLAESEAKLKECQLHLKGPVK